MSSTQRLAYTDAELSSLLHVSKRTLYRLRKAGLLRAVRIGRAVRTPAEEISRLLETKPQPKQNEGASQSARIQP